MAEKREFKVVLLGEGCVGKTSLVLRYCRGQFNDKHVTTLQVASLLGAVVVPRGYSLNPLSSSLAVE
jgi:Ras-related protein Rab-21